MITVEHAVPCEVRQAAPIKRPFSSSPDMSALLSRHPDPRWFVPTTYNANFLLPGSMPSLLDPRD